MKQFQHFKSMFLIILTLSVVGSAFSQRTVDVASMQNLSDVIFGDTLDTGARIDDNTVYVLERDGYYPVSKSLALDVPLQIMTAEGSGSRAYIYPMASTTGDYPQLIKSNSDIILTSVQITNQNGIDAQPKWGGFRAQGENSKVVLTDCYIDWDKASAVQIRANGVSITMEGCHMGKFGNYKAINGNGRLIDAREFSMDEIYIHNCTFYYVTDRIIRNMQGGVINSFIFDHNTGAHIQGYHGLFHLGHVKYCQITNNLIMNPKYMGNHPNVSEQTGPAPDSENHYLVTADTIMSETNFVIHHNNFAYDQVVLDMFDANDSISKPEVLAPIVAESMGDAASDAYFEEVVSFTKMPDLPLAYMYAIFTQPEEIPDNYPDEIGLAAIDATYSKSSTSYTAGENGSPLGSLLWFPEYDDTYSNQMVEGAISIYPNPVKDQLHIQCDDMTVESGELHIISITGKLMHVQSLDMMSNPSVNVSTLPSGIYIYTLQTGNRSFIGKFSVIK